MVVMHKKMDKDPKLISPTTLPEVGIVIGFMWEKLREIQTDHKEGHALLNQKLEELVEKSPTRTEFEQLKKEVAGHAVNITTFLSDRKVLMVIGTIIVGLQVIIGLFFRLYVGSVVDDKISSYNIETK